MPSKIRQVAAKAGYSLAFIVLSLLSVCAAMAGGFAFALGLLDAENIVTKFLGVDPLFYSVGFFFIFYSLNHLARFLSDESFFLVGRKVDLDSAALAYFVIGLLPAMIAAISLFSAAGTSARLDYTQALSFGIFVMLGLYIRGDLN